MVCSTNKFFNSVNEQANMSFPERKFLENSLAGPSRLHLLSFPQKMVDDQREFPVNEIARIHQVEPRPLRIMKLKSNAT